MLSFAIPETYHRSLESRNKTQLYSVTESGEDRDRLGYLLISYSF